MYSPGLKILAAHRLVSGVRRFDERRFLQSLGERFRVQPVESRSELERAWESADTGRIGVALGGSLYLLEAGDGRRKLDVTLLHEDVLEPVLHIGEEAVRSEQNLRYIRGFDAAVDEARTRRAQVAFLLKPASVEQVAEVSFTGGVMPQKSTDFYPKLLSGLTIYKLD
jgi:uncharacterized protein (DUF1015 family)